MEINQLFLNISEDLFLPILHSLAVFLLNVVAYYYILMKFFKVICYSKMTLEWFPMINPYSWPYSIFQTIAGPYFALWSRLLPSLRLEKSSLEISNIIALEALNSLVFLCMVLTNQLVNYLNNLEIDILTSTNL